ncbi:hypothetical protein Tco_1417381 [Tanacetum coccineum]
MNPLVARQITLDEALVASENRAVIGKCNMRIEPTKTQKEARYQVVLDTLKLSPWYNAFLVTVDVPKVYMHQFWFTISKINDSSSYQFKLDKKNFKVGVDVYRMYYKKNVDFVELIWEDFMYQIDNRQTATARRLSMPYPRSHGNQGIQDLSSFCYWTSIPKARKRTTAHITPMKESSLTADDNIISKDPDAALELAKSISIIKAEEQEATRLVHETHKRIVTEKPTNSRSQDGVVIRDTPIVSTKKTPTQPLNLKGMEMLPDAAIEGVGSKQEVPDESKGKTKDTNEGAGSKPKVPDVSIAKSSDKESKIESWGDSEDDDDERKSDDERTESDEDKSIDLNKTDNEEESQEDELVHTPDEYVPTNDKTQDVDDEEYVRINEELYDDVNVKLKDVEPADESKEDEEMTDAEKKEKSDVPPLSSSLSVSSNYGSIFLNLDNISSTKTNIISMLDVQDQQEILGIQSSSLLTVPISVTLEPTFIKSPEIVTIAYATNIPPFIPPYLPISQQSIPIPTPTPTTTEATTSTTVVPNSKTLFAL